MFSRIKNNINSLRSFTRINHYKKAEKVIRASGMLDQIWYLDTNPDVKAAGIDPVKHYLRYGANEGRDPARFFSTSGYIDANPDVATANINPLWHYIVHGQAEGRVWETSSSASISPSPLQANMLTPEASLIISSDYFDPDWYRKQYQLPINVDAALHFLEVGWKHMFDPSSKFSTRNYLDYYRDVKAAGLNPLIHFLKNGLAEGRHPSPPKRIHSSPFPRLTPDEIGTPDIVLNYDAEPESVEKINNERICVHVHLFHVDMMTDIIRYLSNITHKYELLVSIQIGEDAEFIRATFEKNLSYCQNIVVKEVVNRGRDVAPWIVWFRDEILKSSLFLHIHTKKSKHNSAHAGWFRYLSHVTLGSPSTVNQTLNAFCQDRKIGIIAPCYFWTLSSQPNYGKNKPVCDRLYSLLSKSDLPEQCVDYPAGSFFWARTEVLRPIFDLNLTIDDFDEEAGQIDGTLAHGIERVLGNLPHLTGTTYKKATVDVAFDLIRYFGNDRISVPESVRKTRFPPLKRSYHTKASRIAVYSCLSGGYEDAIPVIDNDASIDKFLIVDSDRVIVPDGFTKIVSNYINPEPVRTARFAKTHPHIWFQDYDFVFWIDSNIHFLGDLRNYAEKVKEQDSDCGFILHPVRDTYKEEADVLIASYVTDLDTTTAQVNKYLEVDHLITCPLFETNFMVSRPKVKRVQNFMNIWWSEINKFTHRDQLSVDYAASISGIKWTPLLNKSHSARDSADFILFSHSNSDREKIIDTIKYS